MQARVNNEVAIATQNQNFMNQQVNLVDVDGIKNNLIDPKINHAINQLEFNLASLFDMVQNNKEAFKDEISNINRANNSLKDKNTQFIKTR